VSKIVYLPSAKGRRSAKLTTVRYRWLLMAICRVSPFAECLALSKVVFVECRLPLPRVLLSVNVVVTESRTLPSAPLGKYFFTKCPRKKYLALGKVPNSDSANSHMHHVYLSST
jgi:hypothetical protein